MSKMKVLNLLVVIALIMSFLFSGSAPAATALPASGEIDSTGDSVTVSPTGPLALPIIDDFETGVPGGSCGAVWFCVPDGGIQTVTAVTTDSLKLRGSLTNTVLSVLYTSTSWGGLTGHNLAPAQDWSIYDGVSFWFMGSNSGTPFTFVIDQGTGKYQATFKDDVAGWKFVSLPWEVFKFREGTADGMPLTSVAAYMIIFQSGSSGTFYLDQVKLFNTDTLLVDDYETGVPGGSCGAVWFCVPDGGIQTVTAVTTDSLKLRGSLTNTVLSVLYTSTSWGGLTGHNLAPAQDWSTYDGVSFWFMGSNSGTPFTFVIDQGTGKYQATFKDDVAGWKLVSLPWEVFKFREGTADGMPLTSVAAYMIIFQSGSSGTFYLDQIGTFGPNGTFYIDQIAHPPASQGTSWRPSKVAFTFANFTASENAGNAAIDVTLDAASTVPVTVSYTTQDGTAVSNVDYTAVSGTLVFTPGVTVMTFAVPILDNANYDIFNTVGLSLTNVVSGELGTINPATLTILDNDAPDTTLIENFEGGLKAGKDIFNNSIGFSTWGSTNGNVKISVVSPNSMLKVTSNIESWGGFTDAFRDGDAWGKQDWSRYDGLRFWFYGTNSGKPIQIEIFDNRQLENLGDSAERYYQRFADDFSGWQQISLPFALFQRRTDYQPGGAPADGLNLTDVSGFAFNLPAVTTTTLYYVDLVELYGDLSQHPASTRVGFSTYGYGVNEGQPLTAKLLLNRPATTPITLTYVITPDTATGLDFTAPLSGTVVFAAGEVSKTITVQTIDDSKVEAREQIKIGITGSTGVPIGYVSRALLVIIDNDTADPRMLDSFENGVPAGLKAYGNVTVITQSVLATEPMAIPGQDPDNNILHVTYDLPTGTAGGFDRKFDAPTDLSQSDGLSFWYYGNGSGQTLTVTLLDNGQPDAGPTNWALAWSDEFSGTNGAAPNPANWKHDIGGGGYGNNEWEYYTDSRDNSALDGTGNLVITAITNTNPAYTCTSASPTGPGGQCYATSARMLSAGKQEFTYGRVEARLQIPKGQGIWPAFWMLGNDIFTTNPWPASGEIDIMENIGKAGEQTKVYGTIHGPGYSGGSGIGRSYDVTPTVLADDFHVYAIEWEPTAIRWYLDGYSYFTATDQMIPSGTDWVFDHPFFIIMNLAVGGNWPGYPDSTTVMPQTMKVDYVRVYQAPDTAERFETTFVDNTVGWTRVYLPFSDFKRSATQADNAPNDGLTLTQAQGYGFEWAAPSATQALSALSGQFYLDDVKQTDIFKTYLPIVRR
jgi:beta-glucanase (GH16 family)